MQLLKHTLGIIGMLWLLACAPPAATHPGVVQSVFAQTERAPRVGVKRALLVGINNYEHSDRISPLAGSLNDVEDMRQLLIGKFEFAPENVFVLKEAQATHAAIMNAVQTHLVDPTGPEDIIVFHFSGHGSQMKDVTGKKMSGLDETIVPYDSRDPEGKVLDISGAELHAALVRIANRTKNVTFVLDSCHSGTLVRGARVRSIPPDTREIDPAAARALRGVAAVPADVRTPPIAYVSAATSKENAFEHFAEGKDHGALTYFLTRQLRISKQGATYRDVMDSVVASVTGNYPGQHPSLEGAEADQVVFADRTSLSGSYVMASPSPVDAKLVELSTGQIEGATVGSTFDVYPPGTRNFAPPIRPVARVQIRSVDSSTSGASFLSGSRISPASRAVEREHHYAVPRARVFLDKVESSPTLQSVAQEIRSARFADLVDQPTKCNMQLREANGAIQVLAADGTTLSTPVPVSDPEVATRLFRQIEMWAKWFNVLSISNPGSSIDLAFSLAKAQTRAATPRPGPADASVQDGDRVTATVANTSDRDVYIAILDLSSDGSITVVYPTQQGAQEVLKPQARFEQSFTAFVPKGRSVVTDVLKVFASYKPLNLSPITQGSIRGIEPQQDDPVAELLAASAGEGTRGLVATVDKPLDLGTWSSMQRVLVIHLRR